jgi:O-antigen ligase
MTTPDRPIGAGLGGGGGLWPAHIPRPAAPGPVVVPGEPRAPGAPVGGATSDGLPPEISTEKWPWKGVQWSLTYIGFLGYIFSITTYRFQIGDVSIVCALFGLLLQKERLRIPGLLQGLGAFILWAMVGYSVTVVPSAVFARLDIIIRLWLIALVAANALRTREQIRFFLAFWLACFAFYPVRGALFNYYIYHENLAGRAIWNYVFSNPNDLAAFCILQLSMALGLHAIEEKGPVRLGARLGMAVVPFLILLTKSRGAFLGFAVFLAFVLSGHRRRLQAISLTLLLGGLVLAVAPQGVLDRVFALKNIETTGTVAAADEEGSAAQRYEIWKVARSIISDHPVVGVGLGAYPALHARYSLRSDVNPTARGYRDTHSTYLNVAAETGFVGLLIFLASYIGLLISVDQLRRRAKKLRPHTAQTIFMLEVGLLGFFTAGVFGSFAHVSFLMLHGVTMWCVAELLRQELATATARRRMMASAPAPLSYAPSATR